MDFVLHPAIQKPSAHFQVQLRSESKQMTRNDDITFLKKYYMGNRFLTLEGTPNFLLYFFDHLPPRRRCRKMQFPSSSRQLLPPGWQAKVKGGVPAYALRF